MRLFTQDGDDGGLLNPHDLTFSYRNRCGHANGLTGQATLTEELTHPKDCDYSLLSLFGNNGELDLPVLDIKDGVAMPPCEKIT